MKVSELMYPPTLVSPGTSMIELAKIMKEGNTGVVLVELDGGNYGIVTERDVLYKVVAEDVDFIKTKARDIMTENIRTIGPDDDTTRASQLFNTHNIRRLLVTEGGAIKGIVSNKDTARCNIFIYDEYVQMLSEKTDEKHTEILRQKAFEIMREVTRVDSEISVLNAAKIMKEQLVGEAITSIGDGYAIITENDVLFKVVANGHHPGEIKVKEVCTPIHTTIDSNKMVRDASSLFNVRNIRRLPVVEGGKVTGIITEKNISKYCVFAYNETIKALEELDPESAKSLSEFDDHRMGIFVKSNIKSKSKD